MRSDQTEHTTNNKAKVALYVTCIVNSFRPEAAFAAVRLLESAGYEVEVPVNQTCCGQPNYNNGGPEDARAIAKRQIECLLGYEHVVIPSSSCAGMIKNHYPKLFADDAIWSDKANQLANKASELIDFLYSNALDRLPVNTAYTHAVAHHDSCSSIREAKVVNQVRDITAHCLPNAPFKAINEPEACCGFGGTFCVKFSDVSKKLANNKIQDLNNTGAECFTSLDSGCTVHLNRFVAKGDTSLSHFAEFLANATGLNSNT